MSAPGAVTVARLGSWEPELLLGAARELHQAAGALDAATSQLDASLRRDPGSWNGVAAQVAQAHALRVRAALRGCSLLLSGAGDVLAGAAAALEAAQLALRDARRLAEAHHLTLQEDGTVPGPPPVLHSTEVSAAQLAGLVSALATGEEAARFATVLAREALEAAGEADRDAARALGSQATPQTSLAGLVAALPGAPHGGGLNGSWQVEERDPPATGATPATVAAWWATLSPAAQERLLRRRPERIGSLEGLPAGVRDRANRAVLVTTLAHLRAERGRLGHQSWQTRALDARIAMLDTVQAATEDTSEPHQLLLLDTTMPGRAALGLGDLDTADHVAVTVPGLAATVTGYLPTQMRNARRLRADARHSARALGAGQVATVAWIGYHAPTPANVVVDRAAQVATPHLRGTLRGLDASRTVAGAPLHLSVVGHSYGSLVTGTTVRERTGVDEVLFIGSPGTGLRSAAELAGGPVRVFVGAAGSDWVADLGHFGPDPSQAGFGARTFQTDGGVDRVSGTERSASEGHSQYYDTGSESVHNMGLIVIGRPDRASFVGAAAPPR